MTSRVCPCIADETFTNDNFARLTYAYAYELYELQNSGHFDSTDDFTLMVQPFGERILQPPFNVCWFKRENFKPFRQKTCLKNQLDDKIDASFKACGN